MMLIRDSSLSTIRRRSLETSDCIDRSGGCWRYGSFLFWARKNCALFRAAGIQSTSLASCAPWAAGEQLFHNFFNDLRRQIGLPANGAPVWDWIGSHSAVAQTELEQLQTL